MLWEHQLSHSPVVLDRRILYSVKHNQLLGIVLIKAWWRLHNWVSSLCVSVSCGICFWTWGGVMVWMAVLIGKNVGQNIWCSICLLLLILIYHLCCVKQIHRISLPHWDFGKSWDKIMDLFPQLHWFCLYFCEFFF